jgi:ubiquinone biosynthesis protein
MMIETLVAIERNAGRVKEILGVLGRYGLADWLSGLHYDWLQSRLVSYDGQHIAELSTPVRLRLAFTELGTTFIKLGQMLSTRSDLVGPEVAEELAKLQVDTPADPPEVARQLVEQELGRPIADLFAEFDPQPMASASIAQVHKARMATGEAVVVKIQHAGVEEKVARDLDILMGLAELAQKHAAVLRPYQPVATVRQFRRITLRELDFAHERRHLEQFAANFEEDDTVYFPSVVGDRCSRRVLTMEQLTGIPITDETALRQSGADLNEFARRGAAMYLSMIFRDGFYHADPHPGNLMLLPGGVVGVLDCGMVGRLDETLRHEIESMLLAAAQADAEQIADIVLRIGAVPPDCNRDEFRADIGEFLADLTGIKLESFDLSATLKGLVDIIRRYHVTLPTPMSMMLKVLIMLEGTSCRLDRDFSLAELMQPVCERAVRRRLAPHRLLQRFQRSYRHWERLLDSLPKDLSEILKRMREGSLHVKLEHQHVETTVNRLVLGVITSSLFVGSSLLWSAQAPPTLGGISVFGLLGFLVALYLTYRLFSAIRRSGNLLDKDEK